MIQRQWVIFFLGHGNEIGSAGQNFPERAYHARDMLNAVYDHVLIIHKNNIAVFSHDLNDQPLMFQVAHLV